MATVTISLQQDQDITPKSLMGRLVDYTPKVNKLLYIPETYIPMFDNIADMGVLGVLPIGAIKEHSKAYRDMRNDHLVVGIFLDSGMSFLTGKSWTEILVGLVYQSSTWDYHVTVRSQEAFEYLHRNLHDRRGINFIMPLEEPAQEEAPMGHFEKKHYQPPHTTAPWGQRDQPNTRFKPQLVEYTSGSFEDYLTEITTRYNLNQPARALTPTILVFSNYSTMKQYLEHSDNADSLGGNCFIWNEVVRCLTYSNKYSVNVEPNQMTLLFMDPDLRSPIAEFRRLSLAPHNLPGRVVCHNTGAHRHPSYLETFDNHEIINLNPVPHLNPEQTEEISPAAKRHTHIRRAHYVAGVETGDYEEWILDNPEVVKEARRLYPDLPDNVETALSLIVNGERVDCPLYIEGISHEAYSLSFSDEKIFIQIAGRPNAIVISETQDFGEAAVLLEGIAIKPSGNVFAPCAYLNLWVNGQSLRITLA